MYLWTSEAASAGHPDKVADQVADTILDAYLAVDPMAKVASEVTVMKDLVLLSGEISSETPVDVESAVRECLCGIGYDRREDAFNGHAVEVMNRANEQSGEIAAAVEKADGQVGAGDQGIMFGFACDETPAFMPLAHHLAFQVIRLVEADIAAGREGGGWDSALLPDAKSQVTVEYDDRGVPVRVHTAVISCCHRPGLTRNELDDYIRLRVREPLKSGHASLFDDRTKFIVNPAGLWTVGGPAADTGLSGRKIVVDNYGADCPVGGGSYSGKDPTKVDRSGAYAARHVAKNIVASGLARQARVQLSYAIGMAEPVSMRVEPEGSHVSTADLERMVRDTVDLTPKGIIERLGLRQPIYGRTATGGHFGRDGFSWERVDLAETFLRYLGDRGVRRT